MHRYSKYYIILLQFQRVKNTTVVILIKLLNRIAQWGERESINTVSLPGSMVRFLTKSLFFWIAIYFLFWSDYLTHSMSSFHSIKSTARIVKCILMLFLNISIAYICMWHPKVALPSSWPLSSSVTLLVCFQSSQSTRVEPTRAIWDPHDTSEFLFTGWSKQFQYPRVIHVNPCEVSLIKLSIIYKIRDILCILMWSSHERMWFGDQNHSIININTIANDVYFRRSRSIRGMPCCAVGCFISRRVCVTGETGSTQRVGLAFPYGRAKPAFLRYRQGKLVK